MRRKKKSIIRKHAYECWPIYAVLLFVIAMILGKITGIIDSN